MYQVSGCASLRAALAPARQYRRERTRDQPDTSWLLSAEKRTSHKNTPKMPKKQRPQARTRGTTLRGRHHLNRPTNILPVPYAKTSSRTRPANSSSAPMDDNTDAALRDGVSLPCEA